MRYAVVAAVLVYMTVTSSARAQVEAPVRELTEADYPRILNALQVAAKVAGESAPKRREDALAEAHESERQLEAGVETIRDVRSGKIDALELMRKKSSRIYVPPGAHYDAKCSAETLTLTFTFGIPAAEHRAWLAGPMSDKKAVTTGEEAVEAVKKMERSPNAPRTRAVEKAIANALAFYRAKGFIDGNTVKYGYELVWPDNAQDSVLVGIQEFNALPIAAFGMYPMCTHMATGPYIVIAFSKGKGATRSDSLEKVAEEKREQVLERSGLDMHKIEEIVSLAEMARLDDRLEADIDGMMQIPDAAIQQSAKIRKRNITWYRRHAAVLAPLFEQAGYPPLPKDQ